MPIYKTDKTKDGLRRYRVRINYTDACGVHRQLERAAYGKAEAQETERRLLETLAHPAAPKTPTLFALFEEYKAFKKHEVRAVTYEKTNRVLQSHVLRSLGDLPLDALTPQKLTQWRISVNERGLSLSYRNYIYGVFRAFLNFAKRQGYLPGNPLTALGPFREPNFQMPPEKLRFYTAEQWRAYAQALRAAATNFSGWAIYVFFCIAYYTGMRKGEINALKWSDLSESCIFVRRSVTQKVRGEPFVETPPKNRSSYRCLQIPRPLRQCLDEHRARQREDAGWTEEYRVCGGRRILSDTTLDRANRAAADASGLPRIRIHDFRHSHASLLANEGINIQEIARRLGHSDVEMTWSTYAHLYPRETERALAVLDAIELPAPPAGKETHPYTAP